MKLFREVVESTPNWDEELRIARDPEGFGNPTITEVDCAILVVKLLSKAVLTLLTFDEGLVVPLKLYDSERCETCANVLVTVTLP